MGISSLLGTLLKKPGRIFFFQFRKSPRPRVPSARATPVWVPPSGEVAGPGFCRRAGRAWQSWALMDGGLPAPPCLVQRTRRETRHPQPDSCPFSFPCFLSSPSFFLHASCPPCSCSPLCSLELGKRAESSAFKGTWRIRPQASRRGPGGGALSTPSSGSPSLPPHPSGRTPGTHAA